MMTAVSPSLPARVAAAASLLLALPLLSSPAAVAAPAAEPHPAAPIGGCAVTQDPTADSFTPARDVRLKRKKTVTEHRRVRSTGDGWRVVLRARVAWRGSATVTASSHYEVADCGVEATTVSGTSKTATTVRIRTQKGGKARTKKAARRVARQKIRKASRREARRAVVGTAQDAAFLKARRAFLASLPTRDEPVPDIIARVPGHQACPARLAGKASQRARDRATAAGTVVPQFDAPAALWVCTYEHGKRRLTLAERTKTNGRLQRDLLAGIRALRVRDPRLDPVCTADLGPVHLVTHVTRDGRITAVQVHDFGCRDVRLSAHPAKTVAGTKTTRGVPEGSYGVSAGLLHTLRHR